MVKIDIIQMMILFSSLCVWQGAWLLWSPVWRKHYWGFWGFHRRDCWSLHLKQSSTEALPNHKESSGAGLTAGLLHWCRSYFHIDLHASLWENKPTVVSTNISENEVYFICVFRSPMPMRQRRLQLLNLSRGMHTQWLVQRRYAIRCQQLYVVVFSNACE